MSGLAALGASGLVAAEGIYSATAGPRALVRFISQEGKRDTICVFDCAKQQTHKYSAKASRLPVEYGADSSDHVTKEPESVDFELMITDTPFRDSDDGKATLNDPSTYDKQLVTEAGLTAVSAVAGPLGIAAATVGYSLYSADGKDAPSRSIAAYNTLVTCWEQSQLLTVKTKLKTYTNMIIESLSVPRDSKTGDALTFNISMSKLNIVAAQSVAASDVANARLAGGKKSLGTQQTEDKTSLLDQAKESFAQGRYLTGGGDVADIGQRFDIIKAARAANP